MSPLHLLQEIGRQEKMQSVSFLPNARICPNEGIWNNGHYYTKNIIDDCKAYVSLLIQNSTKQNWLFAGDSSIGRLVVEFRNQHKSCYVAKRCKDEFCDLKQYIIESITRR